MENNHKESLEDTIERALSEQEQNGNEVMHARKQVLNRLLDQTLS